MATKSIAWNNGTGNITLTYQGQGDGPISIQSDANNGSARSQVITVETVGGAITRNFTVRQAACPFPVGDVKNFSYTGSYQEVELPAGQYKLQCWGAQGGSNAAASSYGITAKAGGKGGYAEGIITLSSKTTVRVYVGGAGSSSAGGFNGGGSTSGSSSYNSGDTYGTSRMGGGGGATDIRLSDGALLSRMIVAGGGSGGAMCYKKVTSSVQRSETINWGFNRYGFSYDVTNSIDWVFYDAYGNLSNMTTYGSSNGTGYFTCASNANIGGVQICLDLSSYTFPVTVKFTTSGGNDVKMFLATSLNNTTWGSSGLIYKGIQSGNVSVTLTDSSHPIVLYYCNDNKPGLTLANTTVTYTQTDSMSSHSASNGNMSWSCASVSTHLGGCVVYLDLSSYSFPVNVTFNVVSAGGIAGVCLAKSVERTDWAQYKSEIITGVATGTGTKTITLTDSNYPILFYYCNDNKTGMSITSTARTWTETSTTTSTDSQVGLVGGGITGGGYSSSYCGSQTGAGSGGSFGQGSNQTTTNYRYCSGAGGGGWYGGGGGSYSDSSTTNCKYSGGGSGFVNTAASAGNRPSGYTGLELDSGETKAGNTSFPSTSGGTETGHSGNGYAKITRLA